MINYVTINPTSNTAIAFDKYTGGDWNTFKNNFESINTNLKLVDIGSSNFPTSQNWYSGEGLYQRLPNTGGESFLSIQQNILKNITQKFDEIQYSGSVVFKGHHFPRSHDVRNDVALLACAANTTPFMASSLLPLKVNSISFEEVTIETVEEALDFALAMLSPTKSLYNSQADEVAEVMAMTTITQLITYIDPR